MAISEYWAVPEALMACAEAGRPLTLIDLDRCPPDAVLTALPVHPVIGVGDARHPLAARLDAIVEPPVSIDRLIANIERAPRAASALVQLLRSVEGLAIERSLILESMCFAMLQGSAEHAMWLASRTASPRTPPGKLAVQRHDDSLSVVIDRPWALNAIDRQMRDDLYAAFTVAAIDPDIRHLTLRSVGAAFSVGADLAEFGTTRDPVAAHEIRLRTLPARALTRFTGKTEAHIQGACVGSGLELAAFATRLTANPSAWFQLPEIAMGIIPGAGGCVSVMRRIGRQRAGLMILAGRRIDAGAALRWGLIDAIVDTPPVDEHGADQIG